MVDLVTVDDEDPRIEYTGTWFKLGSGNEFNGTTKGTVEPGSQATFIFTGNFVAVYGTITDNSLQVPPISIYSIDGSDPVTYAPTPGPLTLYNQQFFKSLPLQDGNHALVITYIANGSRFWLDYIQYMPTNQSSSQIVTVIETSIATSSDIPNIVTSPTTTANTITQTITNNPGEERGNVTSSDDASTVSKTAETDNKSPTLPANPIATPSSTPPLITSESSKVPTGAIVGGVVGGVVISTVIFLLLWRRWRSRRTQLRQRFTSSQMNIWSRPSSPPTVTPFVMGQNFVSSQPVLSAPTPYTQTGVHIYLR